MMPVCVPPGSGLVSRETAHAEDGSCRSDAVHSSTVCLSGRQKRGREEESSGRTAHLHDAPGLRQDVQGHGETQSKKKKLTQISVMVSLCSVCSLSCNKDRELAAADLAAAV